MFLVDQVVVGLALDTAQARLARLAASGALFSSAQDACNCGNTGPARVGATGIPRLVRVQARELASTKDSAGLAIRWEAVGTGDGPGLFPVLDADLLLSPAGDHLTLLTLTGSYRPPCGRPGDAVDGAVMQQVAVATIRKFLTSMAAAITRQATESSSSTSNR